MRHLLIFLSFHGLNFIVVVNVSMRLASLTHVSVRQVCVVLMNSIL
jgi:hypothetical protein